jgi:hypothetical protein
MYPSRTACHLDFLMKKEQQAMTLLNFQTQQSTVNEAVYLQSRNEV